MSESTRARIRDGIAANTRRAYQRQGQAFADWCAAEVRSSFPATAQTFAEYASSR
ncbi:hypothetical protein [Streptosporangium sp. OZ121]|uniref:hypothetical protein n=1 Tax=Streptosporangium sp. OZ121 TaxID=3444183 RepID=UPI003F7A8913